MRLAPGRLLRNATGSLAVLVVVVAVAVGLPALDAAVPALRPVPPDRPYALGGGVSLVPPPGAVLDLRHTRSRADRGTALFLVGPVRFALVVSPYRGELADAAARLRTRLLDRYQVGDGRTVRTDAGLPGSVGSLRAEGRIGVYAVYLVGERTVEITVVGPADAASRRLADVEPSLASLR